MRTGIYAIRDIVANAIVSGLHLHKADASAIRWFSDILNDEKHLVGAHPRDFSLVLLGHLVELDEDEAEERPFNYVEGAPPRVVLFGSTWADLNDRDRELMPIASANDRVMAAALPLARTG